MNEQAKAWKDWLTSKEGQNCANSKTLPEQNADVYLENRLWRAFVAGTRVEAQSPNTVLLASRRQQSNTSSSGRMPEAR